MTSGLADRVARGPATGPLASLAHWVMLTAGWRRIAVAFVAGAVGALGMPPFGLFPALVVSLSLAVWLLDGAATGRRATRGAVVAAALIGWAWGFGYLAAGLWWLLDRTRLGAIVRAGSESPSNMALLGYDTLRINTAVFALGAGLAGLAGALAAPIRGVEPFMGVEALGIAFVVVVIGGMGSYAGALAAGILVGIAQSLMATLWPEGARLVIYLGMAGIIMAMPRGLFGRA